MSIHKPLYFNFYYYHYYWTVLILVRTVARLWAGQPRNRPFPRTSKISFSYPKRPQLSGPLRFLCNGSPRSLFRRIKWSWPESEHSYVVLKVSISSWTFAATYAFMNCTGSTLLL
jgi:hypothetical protein